MIKKIVLIVLICWLGVSCEKSIDGSDILTVVEHKVSTVAPHIEVQSTMLLTLSDEIEPGEISINANQNIHGYINIINTDEKLIIDIDNHNYINLVIEISASSLQYNSIEATGASEIVVEGNIPTFKNYTLALSGASIFKGEVDLTEKLSVNLSGASDAYLSGVAKTSTMSLSGASNVFGEDLVCDALKVKASGASAIRALVNDSITGELSGASRLKYKGAAEVSVETTGASKIEKL